MVHGRPLNGAPAGGLGAADLGTITRADGKKQCTCTGLPLYCPAADKAAGEARGHGMKDSWSVEMP